jgi:hypothetical protein
MVDTVTWPMKSVTPVSADGRRAQAVVTCDDDIRTQVGRRDVESVSAGRHGCKSKTNALQFYNEPITCFPNTCVCHNLSSPYVTVVSCVLRPASNIDSLCKPTKQKRNFQSADFGHRTKSNPAGLSCPRHSPRAASPARGRRFSRMINFQ